uniref:Putative secreted protein n=1 Tax=Ixodes ricinus TaxID=34613 RepID=A0A6B0U565_IXORI
MCLRFRFLGHRLDQTALGLRLFIFFGGCGGLFRRSNHFVGPHFLPSLFFTSFLARLGPLQIRFAAYGCLQTERSLD